MYTYMHTRTISDKKAMNMKVSGEGHMEEYERRQWKNKRCSLITVS